MQHRDKGDSAKNEMEFLAILMVNQDSAINYVGTQWNRGAEGMLDYHAE
jgi:hypothetical protein